MRKCVFLLVVAFAVALPTVALMADSSPSQPAEAAASPAELSAESICYAEKDDCGTGCPTISCEGTSDCAVRSNYVECDGVRTYCPTNCSTCDAFAMCGLGPGNSIYCEGSSYCNSADGCWVTCDGQTTYCPNAPDPPACPYVN